jgi:hypothetical protein
MIAPDEFRQFQPRSRAKADRYRIFAFNPRSRIPGLRGCA